jgi:hypothetical protein
MYVSGGTTGLQRDYRAGRGGEGTWRRTEETRARDTEFDDGLPHCLWS